MSSPTAMTHYGDPCIHCATPHDEVAVGPCTGNPANAVTLDVCFVGRRWDNSVCWRFRNSLGRVYDVWYHVDEVPDLWIGRLRHDDSLRRRQ